MIVLFIGLPLSSMMSLLSSNNDPAHSILININEKADASKINCTIFQSVGFSIMDFMNRFVFCKSIFLTKPIYLKRLNFQSLKCY